MVLSAGCARHPEGFEIPEGTIPQREETYDDIVYCGPGVDDYRANCTPEQRLLPGSVKETEVALSGRIFSPRIRYRDSIETKSDQIRYNIFYLSLTSRFLRIVSNYKNIITNSPIVDYKIKLSGMTQNIYIKNVGLFRYGHSDRVGDKQLNIMIEIPEDVEPGDYTLTFIVEAKGRYCGELPCVIHVVE
jgi:hypothetical protein